MKKNNRCKCSRLKIRNSVTSTKMKIKYHTFFEMNAEDKNSVDSVMEKLRDGRNIRI